MSNNNQSVKQNNNAGMLPGIFSCVLAVLGILFLGTIFVPLAAVLALIGSIIAVKNKSMVGIGVNVLAWILTVVGLFTSPMLLMMLGLAGAAATGVPQ